jgi:type II secretory pathway component PulM
MDMSTLFEDLKGLVNQVYERIQRLAASERDRRALLFGGIGLIVLLIYIIFQFFSSGSAKLEKKAQALQADLKKIESLRTEYIESNRRIEELTKRVKTGDEDLISLVEKALVETQVERGRFSITSRTPTSGELYEETSVDVEIKKVPLNKAVDVLYKIQTKPSFLKISRFRIRTRFDDPNLVDVSFRVSTFKFKQVI